MAYKKGQDRRQRVLFPDCIDEYVEADAPVRLFDAFVDNLKMDELGFVRSTPAETGTPGYDPRDLLKLYIYGYFYQVRSSRKLARECKCNVEVMWLLNKLTPDFRTISDFRKDNKKAITKVFKEFNKFCMGLKLFSKSYISIDGSKFKAVNAKDNNLTLSNSPTDHGQLTSVASEVKADYGVDVLESTADKGYECPEDHADALANGIVPNLKS